MYHPWKILNFATLYHVLVWNRPNANYHEHTVTDAEMVSSATSDAATANEKLIK